MKITGDTKIDDLLTSYPFLREFLPTLSPKYSVLSNVFIRKTVGKVATLTQVANIGGLPLDQLLEKISGEISRQTGEKVGVAESAGTPGPDKDADTERQELIKGIIKDIHKGVDIDILKQRFNEIISEISAYELSQIEQQLITEGLPVEEVQRLCDVHSLVFKEGLEKQIIPGVPAGHPVRTMMLENREAERIIHVIESMLEQPAIASETDVDPHILKILLEEIEDLQQINLHYLRKENQLFSLLEARGISGPSQVMWGIHDDIRAMFKKVIEGIPNKPGKEIFAALRTLLKTIDDMIYKEENILFPMSLEALSDDDWYGINQAAEEIGYAWITPTDEWVPRSQLGDVRKETIQVGDIKLDVGHMSPDLMNTVLKSLPIEISVVDANDEVVYYSQTRERVFPRTPEVIGRKVQNCHPRQSLHVVEKILSEFKSGNKDAAEFWINMRGKVIYIRYFALRDDEGNYQGTLEVTQDVTGIRQLEDERRLLDWE